MMIPPPLAAIAGAATVLLSAASVTNVYETYTLARDVSRRSPPPPPVAWASAEAAATGLAGLPRRELVALFLRCEAPDAAELGFSDDGGGWRYDGILLDNGPILSPVTDFITNKLFGQGRRWLGKAYLAPSSNRTGATAGIGRNRFAHKATAAPPDEVLDRAFDYALEPSSLPSGSTSLFQRYAARCPASPLAPLWRGMVDELRAVPLAEGAAGDGPAVLLGMGYFAWSGGAWNPAPFCLVPRRAAGESAES